MNMNGAVGRNTMEQPIKVFAQHRLFSVAYPFADLKALVENPLAEEDANQFIDVDVRPTKSHIQMKRYGNFSQP